MAEELLTRLRETPPGIPESTPDLVGLRRRMTARRARRVLVVVVGTALLLAGVVTPLALLSRLGTHRSFVPSVRPTFPLGNLVVTGTRHVPGGITDVAFGDGAVWVAGFDQLTQVDPGTGRIVQRTPLPGTGDNASIAFGFGSVWVTGGIDSRSAGLFRVDPSTGTVTPIHTPLALGVATAGGSVWVTHPTAGRGQLVRVDPRTNTVVGEPIEVGSGPGPVLNAAGSIWVTNTSSPGGVTRVDPSTGKVLSTWFGVANVHAFGDGSLWGVGQDFVARIDPRSGRRVATIPVPRVAEIAFGDGALWAITQPPSSSSSLYEPIPGHPGRVLRIDPRTNRAVGKSVPFGITPAYLAVGVGGAWVGEYNSGTLTHVGVAQPGATTTPAVSVLPGSRSGWKRYIDPNYGVSIEIPDSWTFRDAASGPLGALTMFGVGSWPFPTGEDKDGCAPRPALDALPREGAFLWVQEQGTGFPRRPKAFHLGRPTAPECVGGPAYLIDFRDAGRFFQAQIRFGPRAPAALRQRTLRVLDSFRATKN